MCRINGRTSTTWLAEDEWQPGPMASAAEWASSFQWTIVTKITEKGPHGYLSTSDELRTNVVPVQQAGPGLPPIR